MKILRNRLDAFGQKWDLADIEGNEKAVNEETDFDSILDFYELLKNNNPQLLQTIMEKCTQVLETKKLTIFHKRDNGKKNPKEESKLKKSEKARKKISINKKVKNLKRKKGNRLNNKSKKKKKNKN